MTHALIVGGGIAGAVTAMSLRKAGIDSTVYESYPTGADDVGAFLVLFHNGLEALRTIDAHRPVLDVSFPAERIEMLSHTGDSLGIRAVSGRETAPGDTGKEGGRTRGASQRERRRSRVTVVRFSDRAPSGVPLSTARCTTRRSAGASASSTPSASSPRRRRRTAGSPHGSPTAAAPRATC